MISVTDTPLPINGLAEADQNFLSQHNFLGKNPGEDAAAILALDADGRYAQVEGAACPNNLRGKKFVALYEGQRPSLRLAGVNNFFVAPFQQLEGGVDYGRVVHVGWDRRIVKPYGWYCASAQGAVSGGQSFFEGACSELGEELFVAGVVGNRTVRVVPEDFVSEKPIIYDAGHPLARDNPFGVAFDGFIRCGSLDLVGYHDHADEAFITAMYTWNFPGVAGMRPLFGASAGTYTVGWQDAFIMLNGGTTEAPLQKARVQGSLTAFPIAPLQQSVPLMNVASVGSTHGTQGFQYGLSQVGEGVRPPFHPTLLAWAELQAA
jgi:hypothetical protein